MSASCLECDTSPGSLHYPWCSYYQPHPDIVRKPITSDGSSTDYYNIPEGSRDLHDLILHKKMPFGVGNIFKACYRMGEKDGTDMDYDLNKIIFFATRQKEKNAKDRLNGANPTNQ